MWLITVHSSGGVITSPNKLNHHLKTAEIWMEQAKHNILSYLLIACFDRTSLKQKYLI